MASSAPPAGRPPRQASGRSSPVASGHGRGGRRGDRLLPRDNIGIQLFTVRDQVSALGFEAVFARLSDIGYREIEFAGYNAGTPPAAGTPTRSCGGCSGGTACARSAAT